MPASHKRSGDAFELRAFAQNDALEILNEAEARFLGGDHDAADSTGEPPVGQRGQGARGPLLGPARGKIPILRPSADRYNLASFRTRMGLAGAVIHSVIKQVAVFRRARERTLAGRTGIERESGALL